MSVKGYVTLVDGMKVAFQEWGRKNPRRIIALHGYLDNSNSFNYFGPYMADRGYHVVGLDLIGHGHSAHLGSGSNYSMHSNFVSSIRQVIDNFEWSKTHVVGHSMGGNIAVQFAASHQERVEKLVLIEGTGPITRPAENTARYLRNSIDSELKIMKKNNRGKWYNTFGEAIDARLGAVKAYPGEQFICRESVRAIVARAVRLKDGREDDPKDESEGPVQFRHDMKLLIPSAVYHTNEQALSYTSAITCKTQLILGENGFPTSEFQEYDQRIQILTDKGLLTKHTLPGSHHLHLDRDNAPHTAETVYHFLRSE